MGNTIRREPISTRIPASPDYKYLNITDFRGISQSDNPFILDYKTASDSLNVYVDESNTLTTRPRLEKILDRSWTTNISKFYGLYPLSIGYLLHCQISGTTNIMYIVYKVNGGYSHRSVYNPDGISYGDSRLIVFEQDDAVYVIMNNQYCKMTYTMSSEGAVTQVRINRVEPYIPTTRIGEVSYETPNLLTNKYKELTFWDGVSNPNAEKQNPGDVIINNYISEKTTTVRRKIVKVLNGSITDSNVSSLEAVSCLSIKDEYTLAKITLSGSNFTTDVEYELPTDMVSNKTSILWGDCSVDGSVVLAHYVAASANSSKGNDARVYRADTQKWYKLETGARSFVWQTAIDEDQNPPMIINSDGSVIAGVASKSSSLDAELFVFVWNAETDAYVAKSRTISGVRGSGARVRLKFSPDGNVLLLTTAVSANTIERRFICWTNIKTVDISIDDADNMYSLPNPLEVFYGDVFNDRMFLAGRVSGSFEYTLSASEIVFGLPVNERWQEYRRHESYIWKANNAVFSDDGAFLYLIGEDVARIKFEDDSVLEFGKSLPTGAINNISASATKLFNVSLADVETSKSSDISRVFIDKMTKEPLLEIIRDGEARDASLFFNTDFSFRFDENRWFASGSHLLRTVENDPTYIPTTHISLLGETDERITGYNVVQDELCVVYKDSKLYSIAPQTYTDLDGTEIHDYAYRETKNTVGNNAMGAAIVSAYTEQPLQITYDGIYALKQLTNVYSSDRISESISDDIAQMWLNEKKEEIRNAITLNRLYWTYIILSGPAKSKVYLLDNRSTSWFYWEFPISIKNAFVKDGVVEITDVDGNFYQLTTKDIYRNYKTEYYDDGKRIIPWYWKSQILPLGTMNYSKKLIDTTFIFTDTDDNDAYGLTYTFNAYRKVVSKTNETTITNNLSYVQSTTKKTLIPRCNFIQLELSNVADSFDHNKLRLVGLGLKYVLLEGLL